MRLQYKFEIQDERRAVIVESSRGATWTLSVPRVLGGIRRAERKGRYFVVDTDGGRVSYHIDDGRSFVGWWHNLPVRGRMHWQSMQKTLRRHCLLPALERRLQLSIADRRRGHQSITVVGRITVDKRTVYITPTGQGALPLATAVGALLHRAPEDALASTDPIVASLALIDRRIGRSTVERTDPRRFELALWSRMRRLRLAEDGACSGTSGPRWRAIAGQAGLRPIGRLEDGRTGARDPRGERARALRTQPALSGSVSG